MTIRAERAGSRPGPVSRPPVSSVAEGKAGQQSTHRAQYRSRVAQALACLRCVVAVDTRGGNRMRESCTYGSVRGALSNERPYRDRREFITMLGGVAACGARAASRAYFRLLLDGVSKTPWGPSVIYFRLL